MTPLGWIFKFRRLHMTEELTKSASPAILRRNAVRTCNYMEQGQTIDVCGETNEVQLC